MCVSLSSGCLKPHCEKDSHCGPGERCDPSTNECYAIDAGTAYPIDGRVTSQDASTTPDAGDAGPSCTGPMDCTNDNLPICDDDTDQCRACTVDPMDCPMQYPFQPYCHVASGACGACAISADHCDDATPICDDTSLTCRACSGNPECLARGITRPLCDDGACVECIDSSDDCDDPLEPICDTEDGECRGCANHVECITEYPLMPACGPNGSCVECTQTEHDACTGVEPICDAITYQCRGCENHADCDPPFGGGVCNNDGSCVDATDIVHVDIDNVACSDGGTGTASVPFCNIQPAFGEVTLTRNVVLVRTGTYDAIVIDDTDVRIVGVGNNVVITANLNNTSNVTITGTSVVTIENLIIQDAAGTGVGVFCAGDPTDQPTLKLVRSKIISNAGGGLSLDRCNFSVKNNFIVGNGGSDSDFGGVYIGITQTTLEFAYNTVADNEINDGNPSGIRCVDTVTISRSIVHGNENGDLRDNCTEDMVYDTIDGDPLFVNPVPGGFDYHLQTNPTRSPCIDAAGATGTPGHDIDGDERPMGGFYDIGADEAG